MHSIHMLVVCDAFKNAYSRTHFVHVQSQIVHRKNFIKIDHDHHDSINSVSGW